MNPLRVASALILRDFQVLLGLRSPDRRICPNLWDLIGGHLEEGETPQAALVRELQEEIGVVPTLFSPLVVLDFTAEAGEAVFLHVFLVEGLSTEPRLANAEHTALMWRPLELAAELPSLASERYRPILRSLAASRRREN